MLLVAQVAHSAATAPLQAAPVMLVLASVAVSLLAATQAIAPLAVAKTISASRH
jgi:hypothetical protein